MRLRPIQAAPEPRYPTRRTVQRALRRLAAVASASAALWVGGCGGGDDCPSRTAGEPPPITARPGGTVTATRPPAADAGAARPEGIMVDSPVGAPLTLGLPPGERPPPAPIPPEASPPPPPPYKPPEPQQIAAPDPAPPPPPEDDPVRLAGRRAPPRLE